MRVITSVGGGAGGAVDAFCLEVRESGVAEMGVIGGGGGRTSVNDVVVAWGVRGSWVHPANFSAGRMVFLIRRAVGAIAEGPFGAASAIARR